MCILKANQANELVEYKIVQYNYLFIQFKFKVDIYIINKTM